MFANFAARSVWRVLSVGRSAFSVRMSSVSQTLSFDAYDVYGFDIDHTLAKYNLPNLFTDCYLAMANYLIEKKGYSRDLLTFDKDFLMRGLVIDHQEGNFLKLAKDGTILRASHGTKFMSNEEVEKLYGPERHWQHFDTLIDSVDNMYDRFSVLENFFDMPFGVLCARLVDCVDKQACDIRDFYNIHLDAFEAAVFIYHPTHFAANKGTFYQKWKEDADHYVYQSSDRVKKWLKKMQMSGKKLFVLTSSFSDFARASLEHILGDDWQSYFCAYLTLAKKPSFFTSDRPFISIVDDQEKESVSRLEEGKFYARGNIDAFNAFLAQITGKDNPKVLFFGDSMRSDVTPAKKYANWDTVLVLEEMEAELDDTCDISESINDDSDPASKHDHIIYPSALEREFLTSRQWGSLFTDDILADKDQGEPLHMNTLWGYVIQKYADISIPHLEHITELPTDHAFDVFNHELTTAWGFYPRVPQALRNSNTVPDDV